MPATPVLKYKCDRCTRVWYSEAAEPAYTLELTANLDAQVAQVRFECLCAGCRKTVRSLVDAIGKVIVKNSPIRGAKKKAESAGGETPPPADPKTTPSIPAAPAAAGSSGTAPKSLRPQQPETLVVAAVTASGAPPVAPAVARPSKPG